MQRLLTATIAAAFLLLTFASYAADGLDFGNPIQNLYHFPELRPALSEAYWTNDTLDYETVINELAKQTHQGNLAAENLWGLVVLAHSHTPAQVKDGVALIKKSANHGFLFAMTSLGDLYKKGQYVHLNYNEAVHWYKQAAEKGDAYGQLALGYCYQHGLGVTPNLADAAGYYRQSAAQTNYTAMQYLGFLLSNGYGVAQDTVEAKQWLTRAASEGHDPRAMYYLGILYQQDTTDTNAPAEAFHWYFKSAENKDPLAACQLAGCYLDGIGTATNLDNFHLWLFKSAMFGSTVGQYAIARAYHLGDGVPVDETNSLVWLRKAAAKNHPLALHDLAIYYLADQTDTNSLALARACMLGAAEMGNREAQMQLSGIYFQTGTSSGDINEGKKWLNTSADNDWPRAQYLLYRLYSHSLNAADYHLPALHKDMPLALQWLSRAASQQYLPAMDTLAMLLLAGKDLPVDKSQAEKLLRSAANHGYGPAQIHLGEALLHHDLPAADPLEAAVWLQIAADHITDPQFHQQAQDDLTNALANLKDTQTQEVKQRASDFHALPAVLFDTLIKDWQKNPDYRAEDPSADR